MPAFLPRPAAGVPTFRIGASGVSEREFYHRLRWRARDLQGPAAERDERLRTILHLSDLHFGRVDPKTLEPLLVAAEEIRPDVVAISGDLTQRARRGQFREAGRFLRKLPGTPLVVPGNHDVPLYNVIARFASPLSNYRRFINQDLEPFFSDAEIAVAGITTAHSRTFKSGRITRGQIARVRERLCGVAPAVTRFVVTHHPLDLPEDHADDLLARRARDLFEALGSCRPDVLLAGHLHTSHAGSGTKRHRIAGHIALIVQAGTATSTRGRGEPNSFNVVRVDRPRIDVQRYEWASPAGAFRLAENRGFALGVEGWQPVPADTAAPSL